MRVFKMQFPKTMMTKLTNIEIKSSIVCLLWLVWEESYAHSFKLDYLRLWLLEQAFPLFFFFELILTMTPGVLSTAQQVTFTEEGNSKA